MNTLTTTQSDGKTVIFGPTAYTNDGTVSIYPPASTTIDGLTFDLPVSTFSKTTGSLTAFPTFPTELISSERETTIETTPRTAVVGGLVHIKTTAAGGHGYYFELPELPSLLDGCWVRLLGLFNLLPLIILQFCPPNFGGFILFGITSIY